MQHVSQARFPLTELLALMSTAQPLLALLATALSPLLDSLALSL